MNTKLMTLLTCSIILMVPTQASADYFLTFEGIAGSSVDARHRGAIDINSFNWGLSVANAGVEGGSGAGTPKFSNFSWTQLGSDISFPTLFINTAKGKYIPSAVVDLVYPGEDPFSYLTMTFTDVVLSSLQIAGNSGNVPMLNGSFAYNKVALKVTPQKPDGRAGTPVIGEWDLRSYTGSLFSGSPLLLMQIGNMSTPVQALAVPEAETYTMMLAGLGLIGWRTLRRRTASLK